MIDKLRGAGLAALIVARGACLLAPGAALAGTLDQQEPEASVSNFRSSRNTSSRKPSPLASAAMSTRSN
ncbi:MAG: hypothetical protein ACYDA6_08005 [Solirubrobacteraceae bacterium]